MLKGFQLDRPISRGSYFIAGRLLFLLKHNLDRLIAVAYKRPWGVFSYLAPLRKAAHLSSLTPDEIGFLGALLLTAIPFVAVGVAGSDHSSDPSSSATARDGAFGNDDLILLQPTRAAMRRIIQLGRGVAQKSFGATNALRRTYALQDTRHFLRRVFPGGGTTTVARDHRQAAL